MTIPSLGLLKWATVPHSIHWLKSSYFSVFQSCYKTLHAGSGTRAHPEKRQSVKAAEPQSRHGTLKPQSRKAAKPQSRHGTRKPQSRKAAKPQSRHGTRKPQSRKAAKPPSRQAAEPQALRLMRRFLRSSPLRCHRHGSLKPQSRKAASSETQAPSPVFIAAVLPERQEASKSRKAPRRRSTTKRQSGKASRSVEKCQEASMLQEAAQRRSVKDPPTKGWLRLEGDGLAYGKRSATKGWLCLEGDGLAYCETIRSEFRRVMADVMATPKRLKSSIRLNEWQCSFLFG